MKESKKQVIFKHFTDRTGLRILVTMLPTIGITWVFGSTVFNENVQMFQYIFVIAISLQVKTSQMMIILLI